MARRLCPTCGEPINRGPGRHAYCSDECRPTCIADGCNRPSRGLSDVCDSHRVQRERHGELRPPTWATEWVCVVCGADVPKGSGRRKHCSGRCQALDSRSRGGIPRRPVGMKSPARPKSFDCIKCGKTVSLVVPSTKAGQVKRCDSKLCDKCKHRTRSKMTVGQLAKRDGSDCRICGKPVDLEAGPKDKFRPSIDHITPRACGGSNDPENLQLAHLWCNQVKHVRQDFSLLATMKAEVNSGD